MPVNDAKLQRLEKRLKAMGIHLPPIRTAEQIKQEWDDQARALPRETRQKFLDLIWDGKTLGEARDMCGMTMDQAVGTMNINLVSPLILRKETA